MENTQYHPKDFGTGNNSSLSYFVRNYLSLGKLFKKILGDEAKPSPVLHSSLKKETKDRVNNSGIGLDERTAGSYGSQPFAEDATVSRVSIESGLGMLEDVVLNRNYARTHKLFWTLDTRF